MKVYVAMESGCWAWGRLGGGETRREAGRATGEQMDGGKQDRNRTGTGIGTGAGNGPSVFIGAREEREFVSMGECVLEVDD